MLENFMSHNMYWFLYIMDCNLTYHRGWTRSSPCSLLRLGNFSLFSFLIFCLITVCRARIPSSALLQIRPVISFAVWRAVWLTSLVGPVCDDRGSLLHVLVVVIQHEDIEIPVLHINSIFHDRRVFPLDYKDNCCNSGLCTYYVP